MNLQNFSEEIFRKSFFLKWQAQYLIPLQHFNCTAFLSRKRMQKYCFTTYTPNIRNNFFRIKCGFFRKSLILKRCRKADFRRLYGEGLQATPQYLYARVYTGDTIHNPSPYSPPFQTHKKSSSTIV